MIETETAGPAGHAAMPPELQSPRAKLVYLYLSTNDGGTVSEMADSLGMKKIALYGVLKALRKQDLVDRDDDRFVPA
ncbi:MAG: TrmB family transcriptional regulator [Halopenitus sp.]